MGGFTDYDWSATARPRRRRVASTAPTEVWTQRIRLGPEHDEYPELVDRAKAELSDRLDRFAADCGFAVLGVAWQAWPATDELVIELRADLSPRTDGEWPSIRQALAEDLADRAAAATPEGRIAASLEGAADAATTVGARLSALRDAADLWAVRSPFATNEPLHARPAPSTDPS